MYQSVRTLSLPEAANFLGIHKETARRLTAYHQIPGAKIRRSWRFLEEDLVTYLRSLYSNSASQSVVPNRSKTIWHPLEDTLSIGIKN